MGGRGSNTTEKAVTAFAYAMYVTVNVRSLLNFQSLRGDDHLQETPAAASRFPARNRPKHPALPANGHLGQPR
jgi:hypothetical protein